MTRLIATGLVLMLAAASATAAPAVAPTASTPEAAATPDKVRCMRHRETGSNRIKKICMSAQEWNRLTPEERDAVIRGDKGAAILKD